MLCINHFSALDAASTKLVSPIGGAVRGNTELTFEFELSGETVDGETRIVGA